MSLFQRAWDRPVGERMRTGPHAGKPAWRRRRALHAEKYPSHKPRTF